tara:strand:- start:6554 stop:8245 length:1692 start_codon:yes stop_codon:yes gene_type:complete
MAIPTTFAPIKTQDFTLTPLKVNKKFSFGQEELDTTSSGYHLVEGYYTNLLTPVGAPKAANDPINLVDGTYKHIVWQQLNHMYYADPYNPFTTFEHHNKRYAHKELNMTASYLSIPYLDYGEKIKPGSVQITNNDLGITLIDDSNGNLYDPAIEQDFDTGDFPGYNRYNTVGYWGFNQEFRNFKYNYGTVESGEYEYAAYQFSPGNVPSIIHNTKFGPGFVSGSTPIGLSAQWDSNANGSNYGWIRTPNNDSFNFDSTEGFTLSFWIRPETSDNPGAVISKNGTVFRNKLGIHDRVLNSGQITTDKYISSSYTDEPTDVYPFDVTYDSGSLIVKRSDGSRTAEISGSLTGGTWQHISVVRSYVEPEYKLGLFVNGTLVDSAADPTRNPINKHELMFGSRNQNGLDSFSGSIDEVRFINRSQDDLDADYYLQVANQDLTLNTSVVGNVFYRRGNIVISPLNPKYNDIFSGSYNVEYKGTHTIYQYEILCRIKKGDFNLTRNVTALQSPKSDLLINEMTGSLLTPYFTTIGMYNDKGQLLVIGKMGQAIQVRSDVDVNVAVRFDG